MWRGGAACFGPRPRKYGKKMNRKVARLAFRRAVSEKIAAGELVVIESLDLAEAKTKAFIELMKNLKIEGKALFLVDAVELNVKLSARNIDGVEVAAAKDVNVYSLLRYATVVVTKAGMDVIAKRLEGTGDAKK